MRKNLRQKATDDLVTTIFDLVTTIFSIIQIAILVGAVLLAERIFQ